LINLCIPTLNRYDLLKELLVSAENGIVKPDRYYIIDNGLKLELDFPRTHIQRPPYNVGVAASWNWFLNNIQGYNIISNDDIKFYPDTIATLIDGYRAECVNVPESMGNNMFSLFLLGDDVIKNVGLFDESISPRYAYFEDNDYYYRLTLQGLTVNIIQGCYTAHQSSSTLKKFTEGEKSLHHTRFKTAKTNYKNKWGGLPGEESYTTPYNK
jgi:hypothetical protein